jgi:uncharacterized protein DUF3887
MRKMAVTLALAALGAGCSPLQDTRAADAGIATFHQKLNTQDFAGIYAGAGPEMKAATTQDALVRMLAAINRKLGKFQSGKDIGWNDNVNTSGHFLTVNYSAQYDRGAATESFVYRVDGSQAQLVGYHISSDALILN